MTFPFPANLTLLSAEMPANAILTLGQKVFLPVTEIDHKGRRWVQYRLIKSTSLHRDGPGEQTVLTVEFVDAIPGKDFRPDEEVNVLLGAFDIGSGKLDEPAP